MPYVISYGTSKHSARRAKRLGGRIALCAAGLAAALQLFFPAEMQSIRALLLPGVTANTYARLDTLADALEAGEELPEALAAFCREVLAEEAS